MRADLFNRKHNVSRCSQIMFRNGQISTFHETAAIQGLLTFRFPMRRDFCFGVAKREKLPCSAPWSSPRSFEPFSRPAKLPALNRFE